MIVLFEKILFCDWHSRILRFYHIFSSRVCDRNTSVPAHCILSLFSSLRTVSFGDWVAQLFLSAWQLSDQQQRLNTSNSGFSKTSDRCCPRAASLVPALHPLGLNKFVEVWYTGRLEIEISVAFKLDRSINSNEKIAAVKWWFIQWVGKKNSWVFVLYSEVAICFHSVP